MFAPHRGALSTNPPCTAVQCSHVYPMLVLRRVVDICAPRCRAMQTCVPPPVGVQCGRFCPRLGLALEMSAPHWSAMQKCVPDVRVQCGCVFPTLLRAINVYTTHLAAMRTCMPPARGCGRSCAVLGCNADVFAPHCGSMRTFLPRTRVQYGRCWPKPGHVVAVSTAC